MVFLNIPLSSSLCLVKNLVFSSHDCNSKNSITKLAERILVGPTLDDGYDAKKWNGLPVVIIK